jgi:hypothetical protein
MRRDDEEEEKEGDKEDENDEEEIDTKDSASFSTPTLSTSVLRGKNPVSNKAVATSWVANLTSVLSSPQAFHARPQRVRVSPLCTSPEVPPP